MNTFFCLHFIIFMFRPRHDWLERGSGCFDFFPLETRVKKSVIKLSSKKAFAS